MSKFALVFGDIQIHNYKTFDDSSNRRLENTLSVIKYLFEFASNKNIEYILFTGDLFDQQKSLPVIVINRTISVFKELFIKYPTIKFLAISGNHDQASRQLKDKDAESALSYLGILFPNFKVIDNSKYCIPVDDSFKGNIPVLVHGVPYYEYSEHFSNALDLVVGSVNEKHTNGNDYINILLTHQVPSGLGNEMIKFDIDVNDERLGCFDAVFNGHIHFHQKMSETFIDVGSPIARDADDEGQDKGFLVINLENPSLFKFVSLNDKFPTIITKYAGEELSDWEKLQYIREIHAPVEVENSDVVVENYTADVKACDMMVNYCKDIGEEKRLRIGLTLVQK